jgi:hypothetical protein
MSGRLMQYRSEKSDGALVVGAIDERLLAVRRALSLRRRAGDFGHGSKMSCGSSCSASDSRNGTAC